MSNLEKIQNESEKEKTSEQEKEELDYIAERINELNIDELNKELFGDEKILDPERIIRRIRYVEFIIKNNDKDWIINEAISKEINMAIKDLELKKEGISGINATFGERKDVRERRKKGEAIESKIDIGEADQKITKLKKKLIEISQKIEE